LEEIRNWFVTSKERN